jgi:NADPH:quinone reductase-like Zn-dependent oxidoreductase
MNQQDMTLLGELASAGKLKVVIDRRYALSEVPEAMRYLQTWRARGKIIIDIGEKNSSPISVSQTK